MLKALHDICRDQCGITEASIDEIRVGQLKNDKKIKVDIPHVAKLSNLNKIIITS